MNFKRKGNFLDWMIYDYIFFFVVPLVVMAAGEYIDSAEANNDVVHADLVEISNAVSQYHYDIGEYPTSLSLLTKTMNGKGPWLDELKKDPWNQDYQYKISSDKKSYVVYSKMKDGKETPPDDNTPSNNTKTLTIDKCIYIIGY